MPINRNEVINVLSQLAENENLKVTVQESAKGAAIVGLSAFAGSLLGGPVGLAGGGILGSLMAYAKGQGKYRSVANVIMYDMTIAQQTELVNSVQNIIQDLRVEDMTMLLPLILSSPTCKERLVQQIIMFLQNEMRMAIS